MLGPPGRKLTKALLHIGTPKTGTTSFQEWASTNKELLESREDIRVYRGLFGANHYEFGLLCKRKSRNGFGELEFPDWCLPEWRSEARTHIQREIEAAKGAGQDLLISSEVISLLRHQDELARLGELLGGLEAMAVAVVRQPEAFLASWRRQLGLGGWSGYRSSAGYTEPDSWLVDHGAMTEAFELAFGQGSLQLIRYEDALAQHGTVISAIGEAFELAPDTLSGAGEVHWMNASESKLDSNAGVGNEVAHLHRRLRLLGRERDGLAAQLKLAEEGARRQRARIASLEREVLEARSELHAAKQEAERSSLTLASMGASASWRVTRPAREVKRILCRTRPGGAHRGRFALQTATATGLTVGVAALLLLA